MAVKASLLYIAEHVVCPSSLLIGSYGSDPSSVILPSLPLVGSGSVSR